MKTVYDYRRENMQLLMKQLAERSGARVGKQRIFAERADMAPSHVSQIVQQRRSMGQQVARRIEQKLSLPEGVMDLPNLGINEEQEGDTLTSRYTHAKRVAGTCQVGDDGAVAWEREEIDPRYAFHRDWLDARGIALHRCRLIEIRDPANAPYLNPGDDALIDTGDREIRSDQVYALMVGGDIRVQRVRHRADGILEIRSDQASSLYPVETVPAEHIGRLNVLGRVVWRGG